MGPIASFLKDNDQDEAMQKAAKEALDVTVKLVNTRFQTFESQLNIGLGPIQKVPGQYLIASQKFISANVSRGSQSNRTAISGLVSSFAQGDIATGIIDTLFTALDIILGSFSASYNENQDYIVLANLIGGVYRIDYLVMNQTLQATGITNSINSVFGSYLVISSVNKAEVKDDNVYRVLVDRQFPNQTLVLKLLIIKLIKEEPLTTEEITMIGNMTYQPLHFKDGVLVGPDGKPIYPPPLNPSSPGNNSGGKGQTPSKTNNNPGGSGGSAFAILPNRQLNVGKNKSVKRISSIELSRLDPRERLEYQIDYNQRVKANLEQQINEAEASKAHIEETIKQFQEELQRTISEAKKLEDRLFKQAYQEETVKLIETLRALAKQGITLQEVRKKYEEEALQLKEIEAALPSHHD